MISADGNQRLAVSSQQLAVSSQQLAISNQQSMVSSYTDLLSQSSINLSISTFTCSKSLDCCCHIMSSCWGLRFSGYCCLTNMVCWSLVTYYPSAWSFTWSSVIIWYCKSWSFTMWSVTYSYIWSLITWLANNSENVNRISLSNSFHFLRNLKYFSFLILENFLKVDPFQSFLNFE